MNNNWGNPGNANQPDQRIDSAAIDKLIAAHRVIGESRMIPTDTLPDHVTEAQCTAVIEAVKAYLKESGIPQARLAKGIMYKPSSVSQVLKGTYNADVRPIIVAMDRWLERRTQADQMPEINTYVDTEVAIRIRTAAKRAMAAADAGLDSRISLVFGVPGCGKTMALKAIAERDGGILVTCGAEGMSPAIMLRRIGEAMGIALGSYRAQMFGQIVEALRGTGKLIIIDEIHALLEARDDTTFHTLRRLSDESGCPQLWCATCNLIEQLQMRERKREPLGQIVSRIGSQFDLTAGLSDGAGGGGGGRGQPLFSVEEILKVFARNELKLTRDAGKFLARFCTNPRLGLLRRCTDMVLHATTMYRGKSREITVEMLLEAASFLFQNSVVQELRQTAHEEIKELKLKLA